MNQLLIASLLTLVAIIIIVPIIVNAWCGEQK